VAAQRKSSIDNPFGGGFVIGAKKPGTAAYEIEQAKKNTPTSGSRNLGKEPSAVEANQIAEKDRLDTFGMYDASANRNPKSTYANRARYM